MEEKEPIGIKFSTVLIIIAVIVIIAIGGLIYLSSINKNDEVIETQLSTELDSEEIEDSETENEISVEDTNENMSNSVSYDNDIEEKETLEIGEYVIQGMQLSPGDDETYGIESIAIKENNKFSVNLPLGTSYEGTYTVQGEKIVCTATKQGEAEGGEETTENIEEIEFLFDIIDEENLEYVGANSDESYFSLTEGKTYSLKN